jgi:DNA (cytosine-5)-methyltransferase 1
MKHGSLFSGIGGFDLAAEWMGWKNVFHCEWNEFGQKILKYYWPEAKSYADITKTDFSIHRGKIDILTGGFPCQPYSGAGKRLGKEDDRHLWPEMLRAIGEIQPSWVVGENVRGLVNWNGGMVFHEVQADLEAEGFKVFPFLLPSSSVGTDHERYRIWFVAYSGCEPIAFPFLSGNNGQENKREWEEKIGGSNRKFFEVASVFNPVLKERMVASESPFNYDGFPRELDGITVQEWTEQSLKGAGNAIVPQLAFQIFKTISLYDLQQTRPFKPIQIRTT